MARTARLYGGACPLSTRMWGRFRHLPHLQAGTFSAVRKSGAGGVLVDETVIVDVESVMTGLIGVLIDAVGRALAEKIGAVGQTVVNVVQNGIGCAVSVFWAGPTVALVSS